MMNSGGHRGFTVVTLVTIILTPILVHGHWRYDKTVKRESHVEQCVANHPCPKKVVIRTVVKPPLPPDPTRKHKDKGDQHDGADAQRGGGDDAQFDGGDDDS
jgi:hypothetical protein